MRSTLAHTSSEATNSPRSARRDAALYRLGEARVVVEKAGDGFLSEVIDAASVTGRDCRKPGFLIGRQPNFHTREFGIGA
jgi:hypothetical protein